MATIHVIFDPNDKIISRPDDEKRIGLMSAKLSIPDGAESVDIYNLSKKLCEMLLEQLA